MVFPCRKKKEDLLELTEGKRKIKSDNITVERRLSIIPNS